MPSSTTHHRHPSLQRLSAVAGGVGEVLHGEAIRADHLDGDMPAEVVADGWQSTPEEVRLVGRHGLNPNQSGGVPLNPS
jgi:hypothetical protein